MFMVEETFFGKDGKMKQLMILAVVVLAVPAIANTWTKVDVPGASFTRIFDIDGSNLVGMYSDASGDHGFLYDGTSWTTLDMPGAVSTQVQDIDGSNLVGSYVDTTGTHGFLYIIPEPATLGLLVMGGLPSLLRKWRKV